jgi:hypothetical protein
MVLMNYFCAKDFITFGNGIFRSSKPQVARSQMVVSDEEFLIPENVYHFIKCWRTSYGIYLKFEDHIRHESLNIDAYVHMTSPIRRLVDLLNLLQFQKNRGLVPLSEHATEFYNRWLNELEYINTTMRSIRRVQSDCDLLALVSLKPETLDKLYDGYLFDKIQRNDGLFQYIVYLPELILTSKITIVHDYVNFSRLRFKIYVFEDEDKIKKKIRLQLCFL